MKDLYFKVLRHPASIPASVGVASFAAGFGACYIWQRKRYNLCREVLEETYDAFVDTHEDVMALTTILESEKDSEKLEWVEPEEVEEEEAAPVVNIFADAEAEEDWDMEAELAVRNGEDPHMIHVEEFMNDELGFHQSTLTYYEGDNILTDEKDVPIYNYSSVVGTLVFGHGSKDANIVYVRNPRLRAEYEILRDTGYYEHEVLGIDIASEFTRRDLKHSSDPRFRWDD